MKSFSKELNIININIMENIDKNSDDRGFLSQNILAHLRNLVEIIAVKIYIINNSEKIKYDFEGIKTAINYIKSKGEIRFLSKFHNFLQSSASHYTVDKFSAEMLMIKYYDYLLKVRELVKKLFDLDILLNLEDFPLAQDDVFDSYYEGISNEINNVAINPKGKFLDGRLYVQKIKPFVVKEKIYYEITLTPALGNVSKFDRVVAFSRVEISPYYSIKASFINRKVNIFGKEISIKVISNWEVSIRPCELKNYSKLFGRERNIQSGYNEYRDLMVYLTKSKMSLVDIVHLENKYYQNVKSEVHKRANSKYIFEFLDKLRSLLENSNRGANTLTYLLLKLNNKIIKEQYYCESNSMLSDLKLGFGCIPFDDMPFASSLLGHNPRVSDLFECIPYLGREHELLFRTVSNNTEQSGILYTSVDSLTSFIDIQTLVTKFNSLVYYKHINRKLIIESKHIYIKEYEEDTLSIIRELIKNTENGIQNYTQFVDSWIQNGYQIDCDEKKEIIRIMFNNSKLSIVYGSAGTGKTTMVNHIANLFGDRSKLFLANTHPAVENLNRRVKASNSDFMTISKFTSGYNNNTDYDLVVIDEGSTVSNKDMVKVLTKSNFSLLLLVGDVYQIESISFGNWFNISRLLIDNRVISELTNQWRSDNDNLKELWRRVRNLDEKIVEYITSQNYYCYLDESILLKDSDDEIILCLNYDGLYGINNINRYLQNSNNGKMTEWGMNEYKIGDPILFTNSSRFSPLIYNNLKGEIIDFQVVNNKIIFDIEVNKVIHALEVFEFEDLELLDSRKPDKSIIRFSVNPHKDSDEDDDGSNSVVPFQIAYAVSIHKSQGLEYDSVKIIITKEVEQQISHNIFYTAITRAKDKLKIYGTPESLANVINSMESVNNNRDANIIKNKL